MLTHFFAILTTASFTAHAQSPIRPVESQFQIKMEYDYLTTAGNYPSNGGGSQAIGSDGKLVNMSGLGQLTYDLNSQWRLYAGLSGGQTAVDVINYTESTVGNVITQNNTRSGLTNAWLGGQVWLRPDSHWFLVPQLDFTYPLFRVDQSDAVDPLIGDGAVVGQGGSWLIWRFNRWLSPYGYLGYAYRDGGRSSLLKHALGLKVSGDSLWWLEGEWNGYETAVNDSNTNNGSLRDQYLASTDGGSYAFFPLNPNSEAFTARGGLNFGDFGIYSTFATSFSGRSSAAYWTGTVGVTFSGRLYGQTRHDPGQDFKTHSEHYDDDLFRGSSSPTPPPPVDADSMAPAPAKPPAKRRPQKPSSDSNAPLAEPNVELLMKDTQKSLEKNGN